MHSILYVMLWMSHACQEWICQELDTDICAQWDERTVKVNTKPNSEGRMCYLLGLELEKNWKVTGSYESEDFYLMPFTPPINCKAGKAAVSYKKQHPVQCFKDNHCSVDKKNKRCVCSMDGKAYCELAEGDKELENYKSNCLSLNSSEAFVWYLYIDLFPLLHSVPKCVQSFFEDVKILKSYSKMLGINITEAFSE